MPTFEEMLKKLHNDNGPSGLTDSEQKIIKINSKRQFEIPSGYNTVLAYAGDVNSQVVTFALPISHEGHDLTKCAYKILRWKHTKSGVEDESDLTLLQDSITTTTMTLQWIVPPTAFAQAGNLEIAITIFDLNETKDKIAFSWNTASYTGFTINDTLSSVPQRGNFGDYKAPAKDEMLTIHEDGRSIIAPNNYNFTVANYGDKNTSLIHFKTVQYLGGIDLLNEQTVISVLVSLNGQQAEYEIDKNDVRSTYAEGSKGENQIEFFWRISPEVTDNAQGYTGQFSITIMIAQEEKIWKTGTFPNLILGKAIDYDQTSLFPRQYYTVLDGDQAPGNLSIYQTAGLIKHRSHTGSIEESEEEILRNELVMLYDDEDKLTDIAIGGNSDDEALLREAYTVRSLMRKHLEDEPPEFELSDSDKEEITKEVSNNVSTSIEQLSSQVTQLGNVVQSQIDIPRFKIVTDKSQMTQEGIIYLLPSNEGNYYEEFLYIADGKRIEPIGQSPIPLSEYASKEFLKQQPQAYVHNLIIRTRDLTTKDATMASLTLINNDPNPYSFDWNKSKVETLDSETAWALLRLYRALSTTTAVPNVTQDSGDSDLEYLTKIGMNTTRRPCSGSVIISSGSTTIRGIINTTWSGYMKYARTSTAINGAYRCLTFTATEATETNNYPQNSFDGWHIAIPCGYTSVIKEADGSFKEEYVWTTKQDFIDNEYDAVVYNDLKGQEYFYKQKIYCKDYVETIYPYGK